MENPINHSKNDLLEGISDLFLKYGLRSTSMDDIANHLKISKKTLYLHFTNKDDVVEQVMLFRREQRMKYLDTEELNRLNPIEITQKMKEFIISDLGSRMPANYYDMRKYHPEVYQKISEQDEALTKNFLVTLLDDGVKNQYFKEDIDKELQLYLLGAQLYFLREPDAVNHLLYPLSTIISTVFSNFIYAISSEKGLKELERLKNETDYVKKE